MEEIGDESVIKLSVWKKEVEIGDLSWGKAREREKMDWEKSYTEQKKKGIILVM